MKILYITGINAFGGQEVFLLQLAHELNSPEIEVHIAFPPNKRIIELAETLQLKYFLFPFSSQFDFHTLFSLVRLILSGDYDIIHTHGTRGGYLGRLAVILTRKSSKTIHQMYTPTHKVAGANLGNYNFFIRMRGNIYLQVEKILARFTDQFLTVSNFLRNYAISRLCIPEAKIAVVYSSTIRKSEMPDRKSINQNNNSQNNLPLQLLYSGRFTSEKGITNLIRSIARINQNSVQLILCGDGMLEDDLKSLVTKVNLQSNVSFMGWQDDLSPFYKSCDVLVLPSQWEGLGMVLLEAMSFGKAVIATNVGGIPEVVINRETGLLVQPNDIDGLTGAILEFVHDRKLVRDMGLKGYDLCQEKFIIGISAKKVQKIYYSLFQ